MSRLTISSNAASEGMLRSVWAAIRAGAAPAPRFEEGLRVQAIFDALRTAGVGRCWVQCEPVLGMGSQ